jgi:hypothetical protein
MKTRTITVPAPSRYACRHGHGLFAATPCTECQYELATQRCSLGSDCLCMAVYQQVNHGPRTCEHYRSVPHD